MVTIPVMPLRQADFAPFGEVIETAGSIPHVINQGFATRYNDLATVDVSAGGGMTNISLFASKARPSPISIRVMERHPLGSQLFMPLQNRPWLVLVCTDPASQSSYRAFAASGRQGVNYARNVWHHPLLVQDDDSRFLIIDRKGPGNNLEEIWLGEDQVLTISADRPE